MITGTGVSCILFIVKYSDNQKTVKQEDDFKASVFDVVTKQIVLLETY